MITCISTTYKYKDDQKPSMWDWGNTNDISYRISQDDDGMPEDQISEYLVGKDDSDDITEEDDMILDESFAKYFFMLNKGIW